jgi:NMT1/THI5 like
MPTLRFAANAGGPPCQLALSGKRLFAWVLATALLASLGCGRNSDASSGPRLAWDQPIPSSFVSQTKLRLGDPLVQMQLHLTGGIDRLPFTADWQNISGGPQTLEAFRAGVLDGGSVGDTPPIHAAFTGLEVKIIAVQVRDKEVFQLAVAPGAHVGSLDELRGKKIAYAPGQAQGALVLRVLKRAGLSTKDVVLIELNSPEFKERSLVREPALLLADEPFGALDALTRMRMHDLLRELCERHRPAVLLVTHDVDEAIALADRILVLVDGRIAVDERLDLPPPRLHRDPRFLAYREALLAALGVARAEEETTMDATHPHELEGLAS